MKKVNITISYDEEKLNTLKVYLQDKQVSVEDELVKNLDTIYQKMVPASVRDYFIKRAGGTVDKPAPKPRLWADRAQGVAHLLHTLGDS